MHNSRGFRVGDATVDLGEDTHYRFLGTPDRALVAGRDVGVRRRSESVPSEIIGYMVKPSLR